MTVRARSVAVVGTGRVAQAVGRLLADAGHPPIAVGGRTRSHAERAALFIAPRATVMSVSQVPAVADHVFIAVSDDAVVEVAEELARAGMRDGVALHTSGAHGPELLDALSRQGVSCGVLHPLQTIADPALGVTALQEASYGVAGGAAALRWAEEIVTLFHGTALRLHPDAFGAYHAGAVMASNAVVAAIDAAVVLFGAAGVERSAALRALAPLCLTSVRNALDIGPEAALTGPVQRGDAVTIRTHMAALHRCPRHVADLYRASARALLHLARRRGLSPSSAAAVEMALDA